MDDHDLDDDYDGGGPEESCPECDDGMNDESMRSACVDDLCHGGEVPCAIHGDWATLPCSLCGKPYR